MKWQTCGRAKAEALARIVEEGYVHGAETEEKMQLQGFGKNSTIERNHFYLQGFMEIMKMKKNVNWSYKFSFSATIFLGFSTRHRGVNGGRYIHMRHVTECICRSVSVCMCK